MKKNNRRPKRNSGRKPIPERGTKNQRRDAEIANTASREYAADSRDRRDCYKSESNDWQWYAQNPQLISDYASYPFGKAVGTRVNLGSNPTLLLANRGSIPGIMAYYFAPSAGKPTNSNDPINVAARNIYSYVRHANSGHSNYDSPDLMIYLMAMDSIYMFHSFMKRALGLLYDYSTLNRYYPKAILTAMGLDADDLRNNIANFRGFINTYAVKMGSMCVPNSMSYMARHVWMCEGLYVDSSTTKAQTYFYTPAQFFIFRRDASTQAGILGSTNFFNPAQLERSGSTYTQVLHGYTDLVQFANDLLDPILAEEDFAIMSGDILKAFGDSGVIKVTGVTDGYMVLPAYNPEVLSQMENATVLGGVWEENLQQNLDVEGAGWLYASKSSATTNVRFQSSGSSTSNLPMKVSDVRNLAEPFLANKIINFHWDNATPEQVMVATRLSWCAEDYTGSTTNVDLYGTSGIAGIPIYTKGVGSEIIVDAAMWYYLWNNTSTMSLSYTRAPTNAYERYVKGASGVSFNLNQLYLPNLFSRLSMFDWHHLVWNLSYVVDSTDTTNPLSIIAIGDIQVPCVDADNYTIIDGVNLENMSTAALLSEFSVPQMGAFSTKL